MCVEDGDGDAGHIVGRAVALCRESQRQRIVFRGGLHGFGFIDADAAADVLHRALVLDRRQRRLRGGQDAGDGHAAQGHHGGQGAAFNAFVHLILQTWMIELRPGRRHGVRSSASRSSTVCFHSRDSAAAFLPVASPSISPRFHACQENASRLSPLTVPSGAKRRSSNWPAPPSRSTSTLEARVP
ncbi:hypothetical protein D3C87_1617550 [compost metagenome]